MHLFSSCPFTDIYKTAPAVFQKHNFRVLPKKRVKEGQFWNPYFKPPHHSVFNGHGQMLEHVLENIAAEG